MNGGKWSIFMMTWQQRQHFSCLVNQCSLLLNVIFDDSGVKFCRSWIEDIAADLRNVLLKSMDASLTDDLSMIMITLPSRLIIFLLERVLNPSLSSIVKASAEIQKRNKICRLNIQQLVIYEDLFLFGQYECNNNIIFHYHNVIYLALSGWIFPSKNNLCFFVKIWNKWIFRVQKKYFKLLTWSPWLKKSDITWRLLSNWQTTMSPWQPL